MLSDERILELWRTRRVPDVEWFEVADFARAVEAEAREDADECIAAQEDLLRELRADNERLRRDAAIGDVVWKFIDRMTDVDDSCDPADRILREFVAAVEPAIDAALAK